jgi:uncharacterized GH25 family protein
MRRKGFLVALAVGLAVLPMAVVGHEFWLAPSTYRPAVGEVVSVQTLVGDHFEGESRPRDPTKLEKFLLATADGEIPVTGRDGVDPAGFVRIGTAGTYVLGYRSKHSRVVIKPDVFEGYLKEKGFDEVLKARKDAGTDDEEARERYSRCVKAIVCVGGVPGKGWDHEFKFPLEIVPVEDPYTLKAGDTLRVKILAEGKPAAKVQVDAWVKGTKTIAVTGRTDEKGEIALKLPTKGEWLVSAVTIAPVTEKGADVEWESLWASLTFDLAAGEKKETANPEGADKR